MTQNNYPPSIDPAARGDLAGIINFVQTKWLQKTDDMLPAIVVSYDRVKNRATVQPLIPIVTTSNTIIQRGVIASVPVLQLGGGGFVLSCPLNAGDLGWIKANDRDISLFLQYLKSAQPNTGRLHSFENGMFIPDTMMRSVVINSEDAANIVLQTLDGTVRVAIWKDKVKVTAPIVEVVAPQVTVTSTNADVMASTEAHITSPSITCTASTQITLDSPLTTITGALQSGTASGATAAFNGPITSNSTIVATGNVTGAGTSLHTHIHGGVQTGSGDTGAPV